MIIENQVTSLELSKKLKEAGYPQEGLWCYRVFDDNYTDIELYDPDDKLDTLPLHSERIIAPTVAELGNKLPWRISEDYRLQTRKYDAGIAEWQVLYWDLNCNLKHDEFAGIEANAMAKMWLWLKKNNYLGDGNNGL